MDSDKFDHISRRAYEMWEAEGRPDGRHADHWQAAEDEFHATAPQEGTPETAATDPHPGMMGDGTEEQNLGQPGNPEARITADEVNAAFAASGEDADTPA